MRATIANFGEFFGIGFIVAALVTGLVIVLRRRFQPKPDFRLSGAEPKELLRSLPRAPLTKSDAVRHVVIDNHPVLGRHHDSWSGSSSLGRSVEVDLADPTARFLGLVRVVVAADQLVTARGQDRAD